MSDKGQKRTSSQEMETFRTELGARIRVANAWFRFGFMFWLGLRF